MKMFVSTDVTGELLVVKGDQVVTEFHPGLEQSLPQDGNLKELS